MATDELSLLERVLFRVGSAESDEQLQSAVSKFLPPVLLKLSSQQDGVRKKVMELLIHINKRVKSRPQVQLPVDALLLQYQDPAASSFVTNFTIIYIKMGFPRLPVTKQAELVPCLLNALEGKPQSHQDSLLLLLMPVLGQVSVPVDARQRGALLGLNERPHIARLLSQFVLDLLLLPYGASPRTEQSQSQSHIPAGMSETSLRRVTAEGPLSAEQLEQTKLGLVKFLSSGVLAESEVLVHLLVAAADTRFSVANAADMELKKVVGALDWSSPALLVPLYELYLGTPALAKSSPPEQRRRPASTRIRLKLLPFLSRARGPALLFPSCIQVFFESLYGTEFTNARLKLMALQFAMVVITGASLARLAQVAAVFLSGLLKVIAQEESSLKAPAYVAAGKLAQRVPSLVNKDLRLLQTFFDALSKEDQETRLSVREALLSMVQAFRVGDDTEAQSRQVMMQALLAGQVESSEPSARFLAVRYAASVFPARHVPSRYLLLLATGDSKEEVSREALRALYGPGKGRNDPEPGDELVLLPPFPEVAHYLAERARTRLQNPATCHVAGSHTLPFPVQTHVAVLEYVRVCLWRDAGLPAPTSEHPCAHTPRLRTHLLALCQGNADELDEYLWLAEQLLGAGPTAAPVAALLEAIGCVPERLAARFSTHLPLLKGFFSSTKESIRPLCSSLYGIIAAHGLGENEFEENIGNLLQELSTKSVEVQHGSVLAVAHALERKLCAAPLDDNARLPASPLYGQCVRTTLALLEHQSTALVAAACTALQMLTCHAALPLPDTDGTDNKLSIVRRLQALVTSAKLPTKAREQAALALGCLCLGEQFPHARLIIEGFLGLASEVRDVEVHLTAGEALVACVQGGSSPRCRDAWRVTEDDWVPARPPLDSLDNDLDWLLERILALVPEPRPSSRQAACVWLLALLRHCGSRAPVTAHLDALQRAFMDLLADSNELVQDAASKGLALVYESSGEDSRQRLVGELLEQLSAGRRQVARVSHDTRLFEEGALGQSPSGGSLSTYKELCSLASDLNQPDLIYKFMHLANNNAIWNSKKGAAFGFSSLVAQSGEQLSAHLPRIVPRLYRYRFDPTPSIQNSMSSIWHALVSDTQHTVDKYHAEILADLVENLTSPQWRVRYSCCVAVADFLRCGPNRSLHDSLSSLPRLWAQLFRVMDDVHQGVRTAATATASDLGKLCLRTCGVGASAGKAGNEVVRAVLPVLLDTGICNSVQEVRTLSLQLVSQLVGTTGSLLQPHLAQLVPALLEAAGELEPRAFGYLSAQLGAEREAQESLDQARATAATSHRTTDTVAKCVQYVDASVLPQLMPRVLELMKGSVALGTRVASAHFVVLLTYHLRQELQPYAGKLLAVLTSGLTDRNAAVRKHFATTIGYLAPIAKDSSLEKLFSKLCTWYYEKEDEVFHSACAYTFQSVLQRHPAVLKDHADIIFPLVFFATHAAKTPEGTGSAEVWEEVWQDAAPSPELALRTNLPCVRDTLISALQSSSWTTKAQAARAVGTLAGKVGTFLAEEDVSRLVGTLLDALAGRTWSGKDCLLHALESFATGCRVVLRQESCAGLVASMLDALLRECRKQDPAYKRCSLGVMLSAQCIVT
ncbi:proteasome adapter and scaffold protein ECM29 isoform X2 [Bacillus rossius redtenbacheri]|uniref:proteasome adapter and scaffold protein ECM29 isoform X2 n=1 Tax=Bacillus rossius redtenbacheri TaxID=93214 RepID=UPI002FDE39ED